MRLCVDFLLFPGHDLGLAPQPVEEVDRLEVALQDVGQVVVELSLIHI